MATNEREGILTYVDEAGNTTLLYPVTTVDAIYGLEEVISDVNNTIEEVDEKKLSNTGGTITGNIDMSGKKITGLGNPTNSGDAAPKQYVDGKLKLFNCILTVNDWVGDAAPFKQTIGIEGILGTDRPHYGPVYSENTETAMAEKEAWSLVDNLDTEDGSATFTCFDDKPEVNVTVQMEVHR